MVLINNVDLKEIHKQIETVSKGLRKKWLVIARVPPPPSQPFTTSTFIAFGEAASRIRTWTRFTLIEPTHETPEPRVQFGDPVITQVWREATKHGYKVFIFDVSES
jgi:hypothetical protein